MFQSIDPKQLQENVFSLIGDQWTLITAGTPDHCNTMTASWGGAGVLWGKNVATAIEVALILEKKGYNTEKYIKEAKHAGF